MHQDIERILFSQEQLHARIQELGAELARDYEGKNPIFIGILKGVVIFFADMTRAVPIDCQFDFMCVSSYLGTKSTGVINVIKDVTADLEAAMWSFWRTFWTPA